MKNMFNQAATSSSLNSLTSTFNIFSQPKPAPTPANFLMPGVNHGSALNRVMGQDYAAVNQAMTQVTTAKTSEMTVGNVETVSFGAFQDKQIKAAAHEGNLDKAEIAVKTAVKEVQQDIIKALGDDAGPVIAALQRNVAGTAYTTGFGLAVDAAAGGATSAATAALDLKSQAKGMSLREAKAILAETHERLAAQSQKAVQQNQEADGQKPVFKPHEKQTEVAFDYHEVTTDEFTKLAAGEGLKEQEELQKARVELEKVKDNHEAVREEHPKFVADIQEGQAVEFKSLDEATEYTDDLTQTTEYETVVPEMPIEMPEVSLSESFFVEAHSTFYTLSSRTLLDVNGSPEAMKEAAEAIAKATQDARATLNSEPSPAFRQGGFEKTGFRMGPPNTVSG